MYNKLKGKVVIITGASSGIGKALAIDCGRRGASLVLAARRTDKLAEVANRVNQAGGSACIVQTDVSNEHDCRKLIETTINSYGRIDVLINNAGISMRALFHETSAEVFQRVMDVNFWGTVYCTRFALPYLLLTKGSVVGISSTAGFRGLPGRTGYSASKFAMHGFLESLRTENLKTGLHVLIVCPGFTSSEIREKALLADGSPQGKSPRNEERMMSPEMVARRTVDAILYRRRLLILTLKGKIIVALQRFLPGLLDQIVFHQMAREPDSPFK